MSENNNSKISIIISIILLLLVLGGALYLVTGNNQAPKPATTASSASSNTAKSQLATAPKDKCASASPKSATIKPIDPEQLKQITIEETTVGTGDEVKSGDVVCIDYKGTLLDGKIFDESYKRGQPFVTQIGVGQVIPGWDMGIVGLKEGGKRKLTIPAEFAYGARTTGSIPANSTLIFEVELVKIVK
jgi:FKBP-type peptidyl-prolyl cis-trans isomerase